MSVIKSCVHKIPSLQPLEKIQAKFAFSKIIIFENKRSIVIVDIQEKEEYEKYNHTFEDDIVDHAVRGHYLWLILKSNEIYILDIISLLILEIKCDSYAYYRIQKVINIGTNLIFVSESGERLKTLLSNEILEEEFNKGSHDIIVSFEKVSMPPKQHQIKSVTDEINYFIDSEKLMIKCNTTDLIYVMDTIPTLKYFAHWNNMKVISNDLKMWILSEQFNLVFKFQSTDYYYYPIGAYNDFFYYLEWNKEEVGIYYASMSVIEGQNNGYCITDIKETQSSQELLKSKLESIIKNAIVENSIPDQVMPEMQVLFNEIDDFNFLVNMATKLCQHNLSYKSMLYPLQKQIYGSNDKFLINLIYDLIVKTDLLEYIIFRGGNLYNNIEIFQMNCVQLCILFISKSDADLASICWLKYSEVNFSISSENISDILNAIPHNIKMGALVIWFRNFIPPLLEQNPFYVDLFVKWTTDRVFHLEHSTYWPKIGLKFIETIVDVLETSIKSICIRPISIDDLGIIKDHINYISELKEKYKINMLLSELSSQGSSELALIMLRRCYTEDLESYLQESLVSYASRHLLDIDDILRSFIESEAASCGGNIDGHRLNILLNAFHSLNNKLQCLLSVLKVLDVPWNATVLSIATEAAALTHKDFTITENDLELAKEIYIELNYAKIKVILKKYNLPLTCTDYILVIHKLVNTSPVDLEDLKVITTIRSDFAIYANISYIDKCLRDCETNAALQYFHNLSLKGRRSIIKTLQNKYEQIINGSSSSPLLERNYIDFLKGSSLINNIQMNNLENLYHLKNSYNIKLDLNSLNNHRYCTKALKNIKQTEDFESCSGRGRCLSQLMNQNLYKESELICKLRQISSSRSARMFVESLILYEDKDDNSISILSQYKHGQNPDLLVESYNILSEVIGTCNEDHLHHLLKYLSILNGLIHSSVVLKNLSVAWKFQYIFLSMSSINSLNDLIHFYSSATLENITDPTNSDVLSKGDFITLRIFANLANLASNTGVSFGENILKIICKVTKRLLTKVLAFQDFDQTLVTSLLLTLKSSEEMQDKMWLLDLLKGQSDSLSPYVLNYLSSPVILNTFELEQILPASAMSHPPQYILKTKFNINLSDEIAIAENTEETWDGKTLLFYFLRHNPYTPFDRVAELCNTLNVSLNHGFSLLLISLLTNWDLKYKILENDLTYRELIVENDVAALLSKCLILWQSIENKEFLIDVLNDFWKNGEVVIHGCTVTINPYYYEIYICIYHLMFSTLAESKYLKEYYLLNFLKGYQRKSAPKQYEFELFSGKGMFPEIGNYRLPFHLFMRDDMWSNLKSEITLETYECWLPVVALLELDGDLQAAKDMICSNAVKQTMTTRKRPDSDNVSKDNENWRLISREEPLLRTAHRCVSYIANMEWASACLFYVLQGCARGADQVAAAQLCYQFSQRWATVQPGNRVVRKMENLHTTLSTRHALHKIDWAHEELIRLSTEPAQLIQALYLHPNFIEKIIRHDINRVANEIADKNNINISSIRIQLLENMLDKVHKERKYSPGLDAKELITAKYILKATCPKMGAIYLSRIAFDDESDYNKCKKLRALQCLMSVVEPDTVIKVSNRERDVLWTSLLELLHIVNLEKIDMPWIVATFMQNKTLAINQLIQAGNNNESLKIAAELAHKYGAIDIIRDIIPLLLRASLFEEMIPLLLKFQNPPDKIIYSAWRAIILSPFQRADYPITDRQKTKCLQALNLLPVCPVIKDEDLIEIWKNCVRCKCLGLGCLVLPYMTPKTRQSLGELHRVDKRNLIISLKNLISESYLVSGAMYVLENLTTRSYK